MIRLERATDPAKRADLESLLAQASLRANAAFVAWKHAAARAGVDVSDDGPRWARGPSTNPNAASTRFWQRARPTGEIYQDPDVSLSNQTYAELFLHGPAYLRLTWRWRWRAGVFLAFCGSLAWMARATGWLGALAGVNGRNATLPKILEPYLAKASVGTLLLWMGAGLALGTCFWVAPVAGYHIANISQRWQRCAALGLLAAVAVLFEFVSVTRCLVLLPVFAVAAIALSFVPAHSSADAGSA